MRYYVKNPRTGRIEGPLEVDELNARIAEASIGPDWLVTSDIGAPFDRVKKAPQRDWFSPSVIPGVKISRTNNFERKGLNARGISFSSALVLIAAGLCLLLGDFFYDVMSSHPRDPDRSLITLADDDHRARVISTVFWIGVGFLASGSIFATLHSGRKVYAFVSIVIPFLGLLLGLEFLSLPDPDSGHGGLFRIVPFIGIIVCASLAGAISAVTALVRREKPRALAVTGLLLNCAPILFLLIFFGH